MTKKTQYIVKITHTGALTAKVSTDFPVLRRINVAWLLVNFELFKNFWTHMESFHKTHNPIYCSIWVHVLSQIVLARWLTKHFWEDFVGVDLNFEVSRRLKKVSHLRTNHPSWATTRKTEEPWWTWDGVSFGLGFTCALSCLLTSTSALWELRVCLTWTWDHLTGHRPRCSINLYCFLLGCWQRNVGYHARAHMFVCVPECLCKRDRRNMLIGFSGCYIISYES